MKTSEIAASFVDLALKYNWEKIKKLPDAEVQVLFATVSAARFNLARIVLGRVAIRHRNKDGSRVAGYLNSYCPYKVVGQDGADNYLATSWLDQAVRLVRNGTDHKERIKAIQFKIEQNGPMKPIQLTVEGDMLREYSPPDNPFVDFVRDDGTLKACVGVHDFCNSLMRRVGATQTHDAIVCYGCFLRVLFPREIETYGQLREYLESKLS